MTKLMRGHVPATMLGVLVLLAAGCPGSKQKTQVCLDKSKPALEQCRTGSDALQKQLNDLKVKLAQALQNPGTIKVDPELLTLVGKGGTHRKIVLREGSLKQGQVIRVMRLGKAGLSACYSRALKRNSSLHHANLTLTLAFSVRASGAATGISVRPNRDAKMIDCMKKAIKRWRFPSFTGQPVGVESPVTLKPKG